MLLKKQDYKCERIVPVSSEHKSMFFIGNQATKRFSCLSYPMESMENH